MLLWLFYSAILSELGFNWGLKAFFISSSWSLFFSAPLAEPDLDLSFLFTSKFFSGSVTVSYNRLAASINSSWFRLIPSSSISTKRGLSTCNNSGSSEEMSILYTEIYPSQSESNLWKIATKFCIFALSTIDLRCKNLFSLFILLDLVLDLI